MHSTRVATFLLGAWIAASTFLDLLSVQTMRLAGHILNSAVPPAAAILGTAGREPMRILLHHFAGEQYRSYLSLWGMLQIPLGLALAAVLYLAAEKRVLPQILCGAMLMLVVFQLAIHSEWAFRGREADFPPGSQSLGTQARLWFLTEIWIGAEVVKLAIGGVLSSYIFVFKSRRRARKLDDEIIAVTKPV